MIERLDIAVRLVACGANLLLLVLLLTGEVRRGLKLPLAGLLIGSLGYLLNSSSVIVHGMAVQPWIDLAAVFTPFFTWLFALRIFERDPPRAAVAGFAMLLLGGWLIGCFLLPHTKIGFYMLHVTGLALIGDLFRSALTGRDDDLVEKRRAFRLWLPLLVAAQAGSILIYELFAGRGISAQNQAVQLANSIAILALTLFAGKALLRTEPELLVRAEQPNTEAEVEAEAEGPSEFGAPPVSVLSPSELVLRDKLEAAMEAGVYRAPGLSIAGLATRLGAPEHRLRALINQRMGHRNFSAFLNRYRIKEAKALLSERDKVDLPVVTIAMDLGYNSLPTFNRAFRAETGQTPTDYRRAAILETGSSVSPVRGNQN